ncbi:MurR/RpiR family transcriptional regulator [Sodalis sp. (in: enterobacteria)]|uniref:MurR/RpiR family transcriptional regulator n=1 Tax=Sodalis sp. (in: enterobacteria) TaxID=1898979 RepID=UPI003F417316
MNQHSAPVNLLLYLRHSLESFSPTLQKLGVFVLEHTQRVLYLTITELAEQSGTSEASVTRLCRMLGCKGFAEFKMALALEASQQDEPASAATDDVQGLIVEAANALQDTGKLVNRQALADGAVMLHTLRSLQIYGVAASAIIGNYLQYKLLRLGKSAHAFDDMHSAAMNAVSLGAEDAVIAISSSGSTRDVLSAVALAREHRAKVIVLSNTLHSPLCELADVLLVAAKPEGPLNSGALQSKIGAMLLVELLIQELLKLDDRYVSIPIQF